ncbi:MAG: efflux RND transporter periplasmic adaptor subunit [Rudaea sp.]|nr:efflux RND transporter periplasmic adaptor subunit [Rudaea sp.]
MPDTKDKDATPARNGKRRLGLILLTALFAVAAIAYVLLYFFVFTWRETTDDAYVSGNQVAVTPQVSGTVIAILADETQLVQVGQPLVRLDPADAEVTLEQARTALAQAVRQVRQQFAQAHQYEAQLDQRKLEVERARADFTRRAPLLAEHAIPAEEVAHAKDTLDTAEAALRTAQGQAAAAQAPVSGTTIEQNPGVLQARAKLHEAWLAAQRNAILAPVTGYIARRVVQVGQRVTPGLQLLVIVPMNQLWVDANFKEPELRNIRIGQAASVTTDVYGSDVDFHGRVLGLGAGTGSAFALLPAQNASGNWIKVVQRVPVRIELDKNDLARHPLRIGLSTYVKVDTHDRGGPILAQTPNTTPVFTTNAYDKLDAQADVEADAIVHANLGDGTAAH